MVKKIMTAALFVACTAGAASAQPHVAAAPPAPSPIGEWLVEDGNAHIRIVSCSGALWGVINWTKGPPGKDENNPDPALRSRSVMGMPILLNMKHEDDKWAGEVYNAENGRTYSSSISLKSPDVLKIEGCVLGGLFCGGEDWSRVPPTKGAPADQAVCSGVGK